MIIDQINQLPGWFKPERYLNIEKVSPYENILDELSIRYYVKTSLDRGNPDHELLTELFSDTKTFYSSIPTPTNTSRNIEPLVVGHAATIANSLLAMEQNEWLTYVHKHESLRMHGGDVFVGLDLRFATDNELLLELKKLLPKLREDLDIKRPKRYRVHEKIDNLFYWGVFEYLDLTIWAQSNNNTISNNLLAKVINSEKFTPKEIASSVKDNALTSISFEFREQLELLLQKN